MIRIFVAFPVMAELKSASLELSEKNGLLSGIRWIPINNLHITLFFIGEIEDRNLENVKNAITISVEGQRSFILQYDSIVLKGVNRTSMIWAQFRKNEAYTQLSESIYNSVMEFMTITPTHKDPIPHCTLARIKNETDITGIDTSVLLSKETEICVDKVELWQTKKNPEGVWYESLISIPLKS